MIICIRQMFKYLVITSMLYLRYRRPASSQLRRAACFKYKFSPLLTFWAFAATLLFRSRVLLFRFFFFQSPREHIDC